MNSLVQHLRGSLPPVEWPALPPVARTMLADIRRRVVRHRKPVAVVLSLLLHGLLVLALLPHAPKGLSGGGSNGTASGAGTGASYYAVDLYGAQSPSITTAVKAATDPATEALDTPADTVKPQADAIDPAPPALALSDATPAVATAAAQPAAAVGGRGQGGTTAGAGDDLWNAIAPCWKRLAGADTLAVTLEVTFGGDGGLSRPPTIDRGNAAAITPQSLRSEALALSALAQCGAYPMAAGRQGVRIDFPRP